MRASYRGGQPVQLRRFLTNIHRVIDSTSSIEIVANSCCSDAEKVREGDVFFAVDWASCGCPVSPYEFDGSDDFSNPYDRRNEESSQLLLDEAIPLAIKRGAKAIVTEQPLNNVNIPDDVPVFVVPDVKESFGAMCHAVFGNPARSVKVVGITGTSGKTSTSYLIAGMLSEAGYQVGLIGSLGIYDGETMYPTYETTPPPNELAYWLFRMVANGCTHVLIEISSVAIAQSRLAGLKLDAVCMTNIRRDHLDYHQTVENYRRTKLRVFKYARKKGIVVCNNDDRITNAVLPLIDHPVLTTGIQRQAEINGSVVEQTPHDQTFLITAGTETVAMCTRMIGNEHVYNCLTAAALGIGWGLDLKTVVRGLERIENIPSRLERIVCGQPFGVFIDCGQTPETLTSTLQTLRGVTDGRLICVFGASSNQEASKRKLIGRAIDNLTDLSVITTDSIFDNEAIVAMNEIVDAFNGEVAPLTFDDRVDAIAWALGEAREGDCVLIVGKGQVEAIPDESSVPAFCDRLFVKQWLYENSPLAEENWVA